MRLCKTCGKVLTGRQKHFCSPRCSSRYHYLHAAEKLPSVRPPKLENCEICGKPLTGRQGRFCSRACKNLCHQTYVRQRERGIKRKLEWIQKLGGKCSRCGYNKNFAALVFHHQDEDMKEHELDMRSLFNRTLEAVMREFEKCVLLCANCHAELHYPHLDMDFLIASFFN